jgi:acetolactate synthase-1/3 small subunit
VAGGKRAEAQRLAEGLHARIVESTDSSFVFEITDTPAKLDSFIEQMRPLGLVDVARTGVAAISRGPEAM